MLQNAVPDAGLPKEPVVFGSSLQKSGSSSTSLFTSLKEISSKAAPLNISDEIADDEEVFNPRPDPSSSSVSRGGKGGRGKGRGKGVGKKSISEYFHSSVP